LNALLDVNALLALAWTNHPHHVAMQAWFQREAAAG
jgi:predicted nucleic acid-binding protein